MAAYKTFDNIIGLINLLRRSSAGTSLKEICSRLELSERQVYRLKDIALADLGIVIETKADPDGPTNSKRWVISQDSCGTALPVRLDDESWMLLQLLLGRGRFFLSPGKKKVLDRLRDTVESAFVRDKRRHLEIAYAKFTGARDYSGASDLIGAIGTCLRKNRRATVVYKAQYTGIEKTYEIEPYTLVDHGGTLYLICGITRHEGRIIRLAVDRISSFVPGSQTFRIPDDYDPHSHLDESFGITVEEPLRVKVKLHNEAAFYARNRVWGKDQEAVEEGDSLSLAFTAAGKYEILRWVLSWGKDAVLIEPPELVEMVRDELARACKNYTQESPEP